MFLKLEIALAPLSLSLSFFCEWYREKLYFLHILLDTEIFWVKNVDVFRQNSAFFLQILIIILKIDVTLKSFLDMQFLNYCLNQLFP